MELRHLESFLVVAREQSITAASLSLHITQPALSLQLKALEDEIGKKLFIRGVKGTKRIILTEEGKLLKNRAEEILSLVKKTEEELLNLDENVSGQVLIGAGETRLVSFLAEIAKEMQENYPKITYGISSGNAEHVLDYLDKGLIDFGLVFTEVDTRKYDSILLPEEDLWGVLMRKDSHLASKEKITAEDLWDLPLIISHQKGNDTELLRNWIRKKEGELNIVATYNLLYNASLLVEKGLGYAICYDGIVNTQSSTLTFRPFYPELKAKGYIIWKKFQVFSRAAEIFLRLMRMKFDTI